ncbi:MAG TPA: hypothetical protein VJ939_02505, partial [Bacteroidales bacterium]|nr:hypothetical protein [Bacteroidales bacterium]
MKKLLLLTTLLTFVLGVSAQTTLFEDNFDAYTVGTGVAEQSDTWDTWSSDPGSAEDALVSDAYAQSGSQSMVVEGTNDMILPLGNKTSGSYNVSFNYYLESGYGGYFNIQHFEAPGNEWAYEVYMSDDGTGYLMADGAEIDFTYPQDTWFAIENQINIDADEVTLIIDGVEVHTWPFATQASGGAGEPQLGGVNFYAGVPNEETPQYYVDDVMY